MPTETDNSPRKRSPRAPDFPLKDALERAMKVYEKEGRHTIPTDVAAQDIGYKDGNSGAARTTLATMRQYSLLIAPKDGHVAIAPAVETYKFSPDDKTRSSLLIDFLRNPPVYQSLLNKYPDRLPSDAALRFDFIRAGFLPASIDAEVQTFKKSVEFAGYYQHQARQQIESAIQEAAKETDKLTADLQSESARLTDTLQHADRIPIRLSGGRKALLEVPVPFYEADKVMIKAQLDLILTDDVAASAASQDMTKAEHNTDAKPEMN